MKPACKASTKSALAIQLQQASELSTEVRTWMDMALGHILMLFMIAALVRQGLPGRRAAPGHSGQGRGHLGRRAPLPARGRLLHAVHELLNLAGSAPAHGLLGQRGLLRQRHLLLTVCTAVLQLLGRRLPFQGMLMPQRFSLACLAPALRCWQYSPCPEVHNEPSWLLAAPGGSMRDQSLLLPLLDLCIMDIMTVCLTTMSSCPTHCLDSHIVNLEEAGFTNGHRASDAIQL